VLIVACPCALLLSNSFTNANILRILGRNKFYLRHAQTIEDIARIDHIVFDKTGTLTSTRQQVVEYDGRRLTLLQHELVASLAAQSNHPLSRALIQHLNSNQYYPVKNFKEIPGKGVTGIIAGQLVALGSSRFISGREAPANSAAQVYVAIDGEVLGCFTIRNHYRASLAPLVQQLQPRFDLSVLTGDNKAESDALRQLLGPRASLWFQQQPEDKLQYISLLQHKGARVMMIGDGLNDAGALQQSDVGIALAEDTNNFTPASDAILDASQLHRLPQFIRLCRINRRIVMTSFIISIAYNVIGLYFAVHGALSPMIAAILMPSSSLSILLVTFGCSNLASKWLRF
jgi:Cu+-exporting ATPase